MPPEAADWGLASAKTQAEAASVLEQAAGSASRQAAAVKLRLAVGSASVGAAAMVVLRPGWGLGKAGWVRVAMVGGLAEAAQCGEEEADWAEAEAGAGWAGAVNGHWR